MGAPSSPRHGSLQFWPRKRAGKIIPSVNWEPVKGEGILGFIGYKVSMASAVVKDNTEHSMTKGKRIVIPVTILETPNIKIFSVRFYKYGKVLKEVIVSNDKELKRTLKVPKTLKSFDSEIPKEFNDLRIIIYSLPKQTSIKKTPDLIEVAIGEKNKLDFVKNLIGKEISIFDFNKTGLLDVRGLTKGKGLTGPVKRFGLTLKAHKSEKGRRNRGSLGPWHPARVTFRSPVAGQLGLFSRVHYNQKIIFTGKISEKDINKVNGFKHYGKIKTNYLIVKGSVQGPNKRQVLLTPAIRKTKKQEKKKYDFEEILV